MLTVMPFPSEGHELGPHNLIEDVRAFLDTQYRDKYYVYNLSQRSYDVRKFHSRVRFYTVNYLKDDNSIIGDDVCIRLYYHYSVSLNLNIMNKSCVLLTNRTCWVRVIWLLFCLNIYIIIINTYTIIARGSFELTSILAGLKCLLVKIVAESFA